MRKEEVYGIPSKQAIIVALNEEEGMGVLFIDGKSAERYVEVAKNLGALSKNKKQFQKPTFL